MSYCRWTPDSDVYCYLGADDRYVIWVSGGWDDISADTAEECLATLESLRSKGLNVPEYALDRLKSEIEATNRSPKGTEGVDTGTRENK